MHLETKRKITIFEKIGLWWKFDGQYYHKDFINGVKNIIVWFPTIWSDRDYDHHYIYQVLKVKLKKQSKYIKSRGIHTRAFSDARNMKFCADLIQKIQDDYYGTEYFDYHKSNIYFVPLESKEGFSEMKSDLIWEKYDDYFKKYPLIYKRVINGEGYFSINNTDNDKERIAMDIARINEKRAEELLFKIIKNNINHWWD